MSEPTPFYRRYGLKDNPYFKQPLSKGGKLDIKEAFVPRDGCLKELESVIRGTSTSNVAVVGEAGVGKTTLVNYVEETHSDDFLTLTNPIEMTQEFTGGDIIYRTVKSVYNEGRAKELIKEDREDEIDRAGGIQVNPEEENYPQDRDKLLRIFEEIKNPILENYQRIIIHYDNFENLSDVDKIRNMLNEIRDFIQDDDLINIFVGNHDLAVAARKDQRVDSNFASPIRVPPFAERHIKEILEKRYELLRISEDSPYKKPHNEEVVEVLYDLHNGNLRNILKALNAAVSRMAEENPNTSYPIQLDKKRLARMLYKTAYENFIKDLPSTRREVLNVILEEGIATPSDVVDKTGKSPQNVSEYLTDLRKKWGAIRELDHEEMEEENLDKRFKYYEVMPEVKWLELSKHLDKTQRLNSQSALGEFTSFQETD